MSEENYMRIIDLRGKKLTRAEMLEAMPRAEMGTNEATAVSYTQHRPHETTI